MIALPRVALTPVVLKLVLAVACAMALALLVHDRNRWKARAAETRDRWVAERTAHAGTIANVRAAAEQARRANLAELARVKAEQAAISTRIDHDYQARIAAARAAAERLRRQGPAAAGASGGRGAAPLPALPGAAQGAAEAAGADRFPLAERLIATEQAIQLQALIDWVEAQGEVDMGAAAGAQRR